MSAFRSTTLIGEDTDLLLLFLGDISKCTALYFHLFNNKRKLYDIIRVHYNIKVLEQVFGKTQ